MGRLKGKTAIVTGGNKGIGEAIVRLFAAEGASVIVAARSEADTHRVADSVGPLAIPVVLDVTSRESWRAAVEKARQAWGHLDILVNCAGACTVGSIENTTDENWRLHMGANVDGVFFGCQTALPLMQASGSPSSIVNIGTAIVHRPAPHMIAYVASKAALVALGKCIAAHCAARGDKIRVNTVHPGGIETAMFEQALEETSLPRGKAYEMWSKFHPMGRIGKPEEVAEAVLWLASDASSFTTGSEINVDGGISIRQ